MSNEQHEKDMSMAQEVGKMLPETNDKVEHYKEVLKAEADLLKGLQSRQSSIFVKGITKLREKVEIVKIKNSILNKQKIFESYLARKKRYESWIDEKSREVASKFKSVFEEAKAINTNLRLQDAIKNWEAREDKPTMQQKVEFYLYLKQEIKNKKKYGRK